ncbi:hypothetical protein JCGZ_10731 [Jatropha curcas]|uniref:Aminotransferase-like plant mobile domain-containing protein n=1 Tax=Jatropha curcas TaxID=180498 RepID=A0A067KVB6_JATCU|nr:hypothetical protein JCGZ_10731 [Jatropha curcas]
MQARLPEVLEYTQEQKKHKTAAHYRAEAAAEVEAAAAPAGAGLGDVPFPPSMEVVLDPSLGLGSSIIILADLRQAPPPPQLDPEHATHEDDGSSSDDAPPSPPPPAAAGLSWRRRLDRSMAYFPDRISRQYGMIQRVPRIHNFESDLMTPHLLTNLADRWRNRNTRYLDEGVMQDIVTPAYVNWFYTP